MLTRPDVYAVISSSENFVLAFASSLLRRDSSFVGAVKVEAPALSAVLI